MRLFRKSELVMLFIMPLLLYFYASSWTNDGYEFFLNNFAIFTNLGYFMMAVGSVWYCAFLTRWYYRVKKSAKDGQPMPEVSYRFSRLRMKFFTVGLIVTAIGTALGLGGNIYFGWSPWIAVGMLAALAAYASAMGIRRIIDIRPRSRKENKRILITGLVIVEIVMISSMVLSIVMAVRSVDITAGKSVPAALTLADMGITGSIEHTYTHIEGSVLVPDVYTYTETTQGSSVTTEVWRSVSRFIAKGLYGQYLREFEEMTKAVYIPVEGLMAVNPAEFGAEEGTSRVAVPLEDAAGHGIVMDAVFLRGNTVIKLRAIGGMDAASVKQAVSELWDKI
jgi:hypothetical protein